MGAMTVEEDENCLEREDSLEFAVFVAENGTARAKIANAFMERSSGKQVG